ncbi:MAG: mechanosensitive ion channel [Hyphomicrobiales bacterium]|nr:mechanosensitive ion channel [Hyphomicrobiales bacterium]
MQYAVRWLAVIVCLGLAQCLPLRAQTIDEVEESLSDNEAGELAPAGVDVQQVATDTEIGERLTQILEATGWFEEIAVDVRSGVVFIDGETLSDARKDWAGELARKTEDVVAVVNRIVVEAGPIWNFAPAWAELKDLWRRALQAIPLILVAIVVLPITWLISVAASRLASRWLEGGNMSPLLARILARAIAIPFFLIGLYIVLQVAGLTRLALTIVGGTGVAGIIFGFAFRDIAENFLASVLLSIRRPFLVNDFIEVGGRRGLVRQMNTRSTILMTPEGNHVQIPNATIFKSTIVNMTANRNVRAEILVSIGYEYSISRAQDVVRRVLSAHPAVLDDPEPWVLVDALGSSSISLRAYYWFDFSTYSGDKLRSALLRQSLAALDAAGISAPDDAREIIFPHGVPILQGTEAQSASSPPAHRSADATQPDDTAAETADEGGLASETDSLLDQAEQAREPEEGDNLL